MTFTVIQALERGDGLHLFWLTDINNIMALMALLDVYSEARSASSRAPAATVLDSRYEFIARSSPKLLLTSPSVLGSKDWIDPSTDREFAEHPSQVMLLASSKTPKGLSQRQGRRSLLMNHWAPRRSNLTVGTGCISETRENHSL